MSTRLVRRTDRGGLLSLVDKDVLGLLALLLVVIVVFGATAPGFLSATTFTSVAFQLPELGLLSLAMLMPIISGGFNLAITFTANLSGLAMAYVLQSHGGVDAGVGFFVLGVLAALATGALVGWLMGTIIAYTGAHPILVSLSTMIFVRGLGEFLTRGGDISGVPGYVQAIGQGTVFGIPLPLLVFAAAVLLWTIVLSRTRLGFATRMIGSNIEATRYSGVPTRRSLTLIYTLSGVMCAIAGIVMLARFNSVRVGHGESYLLITVLACFLGRVDPFGGFGRVLPVAIALVILQVIASGLNLLGANQHLSTALWGGFLLLIMVTRSIWASQVLQMTFGKR
ncbi:ABC transporter permease [Lichenifustis flavocetrariae]|uniref:ABC transporter permease n=1 Tax=Lichenifustis flavocetrariae TaxID=2949735 RepID=A0AA41Z4N2_9HYPH|nr:ABC transporter permease [Lichenifustis flavocetrariae]MCW6509192.1 ABC transporter permease [Lichenifustis flavocetrariae]